MAELLQNWGPLILASVGVAVVIAYWVIETAAHDARLRRIPIRVHVNGIRGKSTLVRYIAAALREGGIETLAKTTGSATRLIHPDGSEEPVARGGAPTIIEQIHILREAVQPSTQAIVIECMALQTEYQKVSEQRMIRATDGVIANVRIDHIEQLGDTRPQVADSLSNTAPRNAPLYTSERDPEIADILETHANEEGGQLVIASGDDLTDDDMSGFGPLAFGDNVAIALAVAERHGVSRETALRGMRRAAPDPGASAIHRHRIAGRELVWVDLFGVNDVESAEENIARIRDWAGQDVETILVLNNRADRQERTMQFAEMAARRRASARVILAGENLQALAAAIRANGAGKEPQLLDLSGADDPAALLAAMSGSDRGTVLVVGLANIHTDAAQKLKAILETEETIWNGDNREDADTRRTA